MVAVAESIITEIVTSTNRLASGIGAAEAVGVGVANTVGKTVVACTTSGALLVLGQDQFRNCTGECYTSDSTANAAQRCSAADLLISQSFGDIFESICHPHLLLC